MYWKLAYYLIPLSLCSSAYGLIEEPINEKKPLPVTFSTQSHNRISIAGASIEKIFGDEVYFNITIDRTTGNAFVTVTRPIPEPTTLTVVTSSGIIQDLSVTSEQKASEHLILKEIDEDSDPLSSLSSNYHQLTVDFLNRILEGKIPLGYGERPLENDDALKLPHPLKAKAVTAFEGPFEHIIVYKIKNMGKEPIVVNAASLKTRQASWVFLNSHEFKTKEELLCILSIPKREE